MRFRLRKILVAVADGDAKAVVRRAGDLASQSAASVELFSVVRSYPDTHGWMAVENGRLMADVIDKQRTILEKLAGTLQQRGISVTCSVAPAPSVADGVIRRAQQTMADLVAIQARKHSLLARVFLTQNDYDLVRHCPLPLLIVKAAGGRTPRPPILAAVDPWLSHGKPSSLDRNVVAVARELGAITGAPVHSAHVHSPLMNVVDNSPFAPVVVPSSPAEERKYLAPIRKRFGAFNREHGITARRGHLQMGDPAFVLPQLANALKAQILVMGAVSRAPVKRLLIGSTAERVMEMLPCDILVVKPDGFGSPVSRRSPAGRR